MHNELTGILFLIQIQIAILFTFEIAFPRLWIE